VPPGPAGLPTSTSAPQDEEKTIREKGDEPMANTSEAGKAKTSWTPEVLIQAFKEVVTAILGVMVVGYTLYLAWNTFAYVGQQQKMTDAKDVLLLMLGLAGVVVGYYFGRVPADARAAQAQEQANAATAQTEQVNAQAQAMANQVEQVMDKITPAAAAARGAGAQPLDTLIAPDLQRLRDELRALASMSRRRG
jgi:hypothetical protein